jgi:hypothetical protein
LSGIIRPVDDPFWASHNPPNHHNCRSIVVSLTEKEAQKRSPAGEGFNKAESPDMKPQKGWDYNPAQSHGKVLNDLLETKIANLPKASNWFKNTLREQAAKKLEGLLPVAESQVEKQITDEVMTLEKLPPNLTENEYLSAFNEIAKSPITVEIVNKNTIIDERLFQNGRGELKITKRGREQYVRYFADTIFDADEIYEATEEFRAKAGETLLKRRHLKTYLDENGVEFFVIVAFRWSEEEKAFVGSTAFVPMNGKNEPDLAYFEKQKEGEKIK